MGRCHLGWFLSLVCIFCLAPCRFAWEPPWGLSLYVWNPLRAHETTYCVYSEGGRLQVSPVYICF